MSMRKPAVRIRIRKPSALTNLGYHLNESATKRHAALMKAVEKYGYAETIRKLTPLVVWHKRHGVDYAKTAKADEEYFRKLRDEGKL